MIARNRLLLVFLCVWDVLLRDASASKTVRRKGVGGLHKLGDSRSADQWDPSMDVNAMPMVTLRNTISHEQMGDAGTVPYSRNLQNHPPSADNKGRQSFKPKREVDSVTKDVTAFVLASNRRLNWDLKKVRNNTKECCKEGRPDKLFMVHHKPDQHSNKTKVRSGTRSRGRSDLNARSTGTPGKVLSMDSNRKLNLTGSYGVLKLLSKENLVRIVNSQMSVPGLGFPSKGSRSRKRDLIDVNHGHLEAQKMQRQDIAVTQLQAGADNQTAFPNASPVTSPDPNRDPVVDTHINPLKEVKPALSKGQDDLGAQASNSGDNKSKHLVHFLSTPQSEVNLSPEKETAISQTEQPFPSTKRLSVRVPSAINDSPPPVLTMQTLGVKLGDRAADSHRDPLTESARAAQTEFSTAQYPTDEDNKLVNSSHVLRLQPAPEWSHGAKDSEIQTVDPENENSLVFEEAEPEEETRSRTEGKGPRSRSRRSWIWNQFFVIEEYAGPEPVLIGRVSELEIIFLFF